MQVTFLDIKNNKRLASNYYSNVDTGLAYVLPREGETFAVHQPGKAAYAEWAEYAIQEVIHLHRPREVPSILVLCVPQKTDRVATERLRGLLKIGG